MKKLLCAVLCFVLLISMSACGGTPKTDVVVFTDPVLEKGVREIMNKPSGDISLEEASVVTEICLNNEWQESIPDEVKIKDISALKYFPNLFKLSLIIHDISDISALNGMQGLKILDLNGNNRITDLTPLSSLQNLEHLNIGSFQGKDLSPLSTLMQLKSLSIAFSAVTDISPLANLVNLNTLLMEQVQVEDYTPIAKLPKLKTLHVHTGDAYYTPDLSPLKEIYPNLTDKNFEIK